MTRLMTLVMTALLAVGMAGTVSADDMDDFSDVVPTLAEKADGVATADTDGSYPIPVPSISVKNDGSVTS